MHIICRRYADIFGTQGKRYMHRTALHPYSEGSPVTESSVTGLSLFYAGTTFARPYFYAQHPLAETHSWNGEGAVPYRSAICLCFMQGQLSFARIFMINIRLLKSIRGTARAPFPTDRLSFQLFQIFLVLVAYPEAFPCFLYGLVVHPR